MKSALFMVALAAVCPGARAHAARRPSHRASPSYSSPRTADQMSCAAVQAQVKRTKRYYKASWDGPLPIYELAPFDKPEPCRPKQKLEYMRERTLDSAQCLVGFMCRDAY